MQIIKEDLNDYIKEVLADKDIMSAKGLKLTTAKLSQLAAKVELDSPELRMLQDEAMRAA